MNASTVTPLRVSCPDCGDRLATPNGACPWCERERAAVYASHGVAPGTAWRFSFASKRNLPTWREVTLEQLRARYLADGPTIPRWTHVAPDGSRLTCGIAHKDREASCPMACETWAIATVNAHAEKQERDAEEWWRLAYVLPLVMGLRRAAGLVPIALRKTDEWSNVNRPEVFVRELWWNPRFPDEPVRDVSPSSDTARAASFGERYRGKRGKRGAR